METWLFFFTLSFDTMLLKNIDYSRFNRSAVRSEHLFFNNSLYSFWKALKNDVVLLTGASESVSMYRSEEQLQYIVSCTLEECFDCIWLV